MGKYLIVLTSKAQKHAKLVKNSVYFTKVAAMIERISDNPYYSPPPYEKLRGDLSGLISRRINEQHRLIYQVWEIERVIKIVSMWTHYE